MSAAPPLTLALVDDFEVVLLGVARMFEPYHGRVEVIEIDADRQVDRDVDIALFDTFAQGEADHDDLTSLLQNPHAARVAVYTWNFDQRLVDAAMARGVDGYLSKTLPASQLVLALEAIHRGERVVSPAPSGRTVPESLDWPGKQQGLSSREAEIVALVTQGHGNADIAERTCLSINSVKTYIRSAYRKMGVSTRAQAVLWGVDHGFRPPHHALDAWRSV